MVKSRFSNLKLTFFIRIYTFLKIPLVWWVRPWVIEMNSQKTILEIPLGWRTKNHLGVMYFGALAMGAEAAVAAAAIKAIEDSKEKVDFVFKDFSADFHKRAEGNVYFQCDDGTSIRQLVDQAIQCGERVSKTYESFAYVPSINDERVATFKVTLSLKKRKPKN